VQGRFPRDSYGASRKALPAAPPVVSTVQVIFMGAPTVASATWFQMGPGFVREIPNSPGRQENNSKL
jgi:hypothetical protein